MLQEVVVIVCVEERLDSIWTVDYTRVNVFCGIRKKLWTSVFCTSKSNLISVASSNGILSKVPTMLEEVVIIVWVEERLDSFELWTVAMETYFAESAKNCEQQSFVPVNRFSFLKLLQMVFKRKLQRCYKKSSSLFE